MMAAFWARGMRIRFTFLFSGGEAKGGSCWAEGTAGRAGSVTNLFGFPQITIRGPVRTGEIYCRTAAGATYVTRVNKEVQPGWRTPSASASSNPVYASPSVTLNVLGGMRYFSNAMTRVVTDACVTSSQVVLWKRIGVYLEFDHCIDRLDTTEGNIGSSKT